MSELKVGREVEHINELEKLSGIKREIQMESETLELNKIDRLKSLLYSTGGELEAVVADIFKEMGFGFIPASSNKDDLILTSNNGNNIIVVEIKGVTGSAAEKHAAQLLKWVNTYHLDKGVNPKGLLIANTFRDKPLQERKESDFPNQMLPYCERMGFCLITSKHLLEIFLAYQENKITFDIIHEAILSTTGCLKLDVDLIG